jgi:hypothetical protein
MKWAKTYFAVLHSTIVTPSTPFLAGNDDTGTARENNRSARTPVRKFWEYIKKIALQCRIYESVKAMTKRPGEAFRAMEPFKLFFCHLHED